MKKLMTAVAIALALIAAAAPSAAQDPDPPVVTILAPFGGAEADVFEAEMAAFGAQKDVTVVVEQFGGGPEELFDRVTGPEPPDLVVSPQPGAIIELAPELVDLSTMVNPKSLRRDFSDYLMDQVTVDGTIFGAPIKVDLKSVVWYQPTTFEHAGYAVPTTFNELIALSDSMVADGYTPWCNYMGSGFATGWLGTDWIEDLVLGAEGPEVYDQWVDHEVLFTDPRIEEAFLRFQFTMDAPGYVFDRANLLSTHFIFNGSALDEGECLMHKQASFFPFFVPDVEEFAVFDFPAVDQLYDDAAMGGGVYVAAVTDREATRSVARHLVSHRFGRAAIADEGGWILPNVRFDIRRYSDELTHSMAESTRAAIAADQFRFDASDLMPPEVGAGTFWTGVVDLTSGAKTVPQVLAEIDASWPS